MIRGLIIHRLEPKWGGSLAAIDAFAKMTLDQVDEPGRFLWVTGYRDYVIASHLRFDGQLDKALKSVNRAISTASGISYRMERAKIHAQMDNLDAALDDMEAVIEFDPDDPYALSYRSQIHRKRKNFEQALEDLNRAVSLDRLNPRFLRARAFVYHRLGEDNKILPDIRDALVYDFDDAGLWAYRARLHNNNNKEQEEVVSAYRKAIQYDPENGDYWYYLTHLLHDMKDCKFFKSSQMFHGLCPKKTKRRLLCL